MIPSQRSQLSEAYEAIASIARAGFTHYYCGGIRNPHAIVATFAWQGYTDIVNIRGMDRVAAARVPHYAGMDIFAPSRIVWHYLGSVEWAVRAMLRLVPPDHPEAPTEEYPAPLWLFVPAEELRSLAVRPAGQRLVVQAGVQHCG
jgi:hypothetical protein